MIHKSAGQKAPRAYIYSTCKSVDYRLLTNVCGTIAAVLLGS